ncbi:MAG: BspA family leucine-rich repeat surface protein, partial [Firmicutes bacterium]|nr:BspA family leucine-rich repeat surface protein [Bacillota bacterium]MDY5586173.1 BspA family leucine-rich repeat surface protein [Eubacteriales bacterium]
PTRPGYTFKSWTDYTNITSNRSVTANWIKNEAYLTTGSKWQAIVNASPVGSQTNIEQIEFVSSVPSGATLIGSVGVTNETATTVWTEGCGIFDVKAYYTALSTGKYKISFYSPYTIYAPKDSSYLFGSSSANRLTNLTSISFVNFNTSKVTNMSMMFVECSSLTSLNLSNFNTSKVTTMSWMFLHCSKLTSLNVSSFDTSNVTAMFNMFYNCSSLTSLDVSNFNTSNVTSMSQMFWNCSSLTSLNLSNFDTSKVTDMYLMFYYCSSLTSLDLSNFNTSNVTDMRYMFAYCSSLTSLNVSNFNTSDVTDMSYMFNGCSSLTSLNLSSLDMSKVTNTTNMLNNCSALTEIKTPKAIGSTAVDLPTKTNYSWFDQANTNNAYTQITSACLSKTLVLHENYSYLRTDWQTALINNNANFKQENIKTIQFVKSVPSGSGYTQVPVGATTSAGTTAYASGTAGVSDITAYVKANSSDSTKYDVIFYSPVTIYAPVDSSFLFSNSSDSNSLTNLTSITFGNFNTSKTTNMRAMFYNLSSITSLDLSKFNTSNVTDMYFMFDYCSKLTSLNLSNFNTSNVTNMHGMFYKCSNLTSLDLSNFNTSKVTNMGSMFGYCSKLTYLGVSGFNTSKVTYMGSMFYNCSRLNSLNVSNFNTSKVTDMGYMFYYCSSLTSLNVSNFDTSKVTTMPQMFRGCSSLTSLDVSSFNTSNVTNMEVMFRNCSSLTSLDLSSFDMSKITNTGNMLSDCSSLTEIKTPKAIGGKAVDLPTKTGYSWVDQANTNNAYTQITSACTNKTLVLRINTYTLSIDPNGGYRVSDNSTAVITVTKEYNSGESISERRKSGYTLTGYTLKNTATGSTTDVGGATFSFNSSTKTGMFTQGTVACTLVAEWTANTYAETFLNSYISIGTGEYNNGGTWTVSNGEYSFKTVSTTSNGGPYLTNLYSLMSNGEKYRIYFTAKATTAISLTASFEAGGSKAISLTTDYQEFFVDVTYNASSTYKALTFYSTGWTGQTLSIKNIKVAKLATFNSTYGTLPTPTRTGYTFNGWSKNFFNPTLTYGYTSTCTRNGEIFTFDTGSQNSSSLSFQIQSWNNTSHIQGLFSATSTGVRSFVFTKNSSITQLRFKYNGNNVDSCFYYDVSSLPDGSYVIQFNITTMQMNKIVVKDIMIEQNANNSKTTYVSSTNYVLASSTVNEPFNRTLFVSWTLNESYLRKDWATALTNNNANFKQANIKTIQFVKSVPSGSGYTQVPVGATTSAGTTAFVSGTAGVSDIIAYVKANSSDSSKYDVIFYSPVTIYAPVDSSNLFSNSTYANQLKSLTSISFSNFNTSNVTDMYGMFYGCQALTSLDVSNFNTSKVTNMGYMFYACFKLTSLNVSNFNTSKVTGMSGMFNACSELTSLNLSNFNTSQATNMDRMFKDCSSLTSLNVSSFSTSKVTDMSRMFQSCSKLTSLNVSNFSTSNVINMESMFEYCSKLTSLNLSNFNTSNVTNMLGMFTNCSSLTSLNLSNFNTSKVTSMNSMFYGCQALTSLNLSSFDMSKVTNTEGMLAGCSGLTEIKTPKTMGSTTVSLPGTSDSLHAWYKSTDSNRNTPYTTISSSNTNSTLNLRVIMRTITITWGSDSNGNGNWSFDVQWNGSVQVSSSQGGTQSGNRTFRVEATTSIQCSFWIQSPPGLIWHKTGSVSISGTCTNSNFGSNTAPTAKGEAHRTANASNFKSDITISFYFSAKKN